MNGSIRRVHTCTVFFKGKIQQMSRNELGTLYDNVICRFIGCHAEVLALRKMVKKYGKNAFIMKFDLLVTRHNYKNSKPCKDCLYYMSLFNINNVSYSMNGMIITCKYADLTSTYRTMGNRSDNGYDRRRIIRP